MEMMIKAVSNTQYANKNLNKATVRVTKLGTQVQRNMFEVASIIAGVAKSKCYEEDGFSNVHEWTKDAFGIAKTLSYNLVRIGTEYTEALTNDNGKVLSYGTNLYHSGDIDFSIAQVQVMLPAGNDVAHDLASTETVTPDMTVNEIKKIVKEHTKKDQEEETSSDEEETSSDEEESVDEGYEEVSETENPLEHAYQSVQEALGMLLTVFEDNLEGHTPEEYTALRNLIDSASAFESVVFK